MQVRMKVQVSGTRNGQEWPQRGSVVDLPDAEAVDLLNSGMAEAVTTFPAAPETATPPKREERRGPKAAKAPAERPTGLTKGDVPTP